MQELAGLVGNREPRLEWTGKREAKEFVVDPVALHIHERISAQAILKTLAREDVEKDLFRDPQALACRSIRGRDRFARWDT